MVFYPPALETSQYSRNVLKFYQLSDAVLDTLMGVSNTLPGVPNTHPSVSNTHPGVSNDRTGLSNTHPTVSSTCPCVSNTHPTVSNPRVGVSKTYPGVSNTHPPVSNTLQVSLRVCLTLGLVRLTLAWVRSTRGRAAARAWDGAGLPLHSRQGAARDDSRRVPGTSSSSLLSLQVLEGP